MDKLHYNVSGLINTTKQTQVKNALEKIEGISKVNVDLGRSSIELNSNYVHEQVIEDCIEHVGCHIL